MLTEKRGEGGNWGQGGDHVPQRSLKRGTKAKEEEGARIKWKFWVIQHSSKERETYGGPKKLNLLLVGPFKITKKKEVQLMMSISSNRTAKAHLQDRGVSRERIKQREKGGETLIHDRVLQRVKCAANEAQNYGGPGGKPRGWGS